MHIVSSPSNIKVWFPAIKAQSGADVFTQRLAEALNKHGFETEITWFNKGFEFVPDLLRSVRPPKDTTVIHANSWNAFAFRRRGIPLAVTVHHCVLDHALASHKTWLQHAYHSLWIKRCERASFSAATIITAVSAYTANSASAVFGLKEPAIIPNWIDTNLFLPTANNKPHRPFRLLFVGNWGKRKGTDLLPQIMQLLGPDYELLYTTGLRTERVKNDLPANMMPVGPVSTTREMVRLYQECDALLFPSRLEGFGLAALEAQACGIPVIATHGSALREIIINDETGILCTQDDVEEFACAARRLASDSDLWKKISILARKRVIQQFSEEKVMSQYRRLYLSLLYETSESINATM